MFLANPRPKPKSARDFSLEVLDLIEEELKTFINTAKKASLSVC